MSALKKQKTLPSVVSDLKVQLMAIVKVIYPHQFYLEPHFAEDVKLLTAHINGVIQEGKTKLDTSITALMPEISRDDWNAHQREFFNRLRLLNRTEVKKERAFLKLASDALAHMETLYETDTGELRRNSGCPNL
jgi:hypothetical protein